MLCLFSGPGLIYVKLKTTLFRISEEQGADDRAGGQHRPGPVHRSDQVHCRIFRTKIIPRRTDQNVEPPGRHLALLLDPSLHNVY